MSKRCRLEVEEPWECLKYSYAVDEGKPYCVGKQMPIFDLKPGDVSIAPHDTSDVEIMYSDSKKTVAKQLAIKAGIEIHAGAFAAAASMAVSNDSSSKVETVRVDVMTRSRKYTCQAGADMILRPSSKLNPAVLEAFKTLPPKEIITQIGIFYATGATLGGVGQKSYVMEAMEDDNESKVCAELKAKYGTGLIQGELSAGVQHTTRSSNSQAKMKITWHCEGGDSALWLNCDTSNFQTIKDAWTRSVEDKNLFPFDLKLRLISDLIKKVDEKKGQQVETYLEEHFLTQMQANAITGGFVTRKPLTDGAGIYFRSPSQTNHYVECWGHGHRGFGVCTSKTNEQGGAQDPPSTFTLVKKEYVGEVKDGDKIYLVSPSHNSHYVECHGYEGRGYGVFTAPNNDGTSATFTIHKWCGTGIIRHGDEIYIRNPAHENHYVEVWGAGGRGWRLSTNADKSEKAKFTVWLVNP